jgi:hypothetical protein
MKPRTTLILGGVFLALLAYVYFGEIRRPSSPAAEATPTPEPILSLPADDVLGITVSGEGRETRLSRQAGGEWQLDAPSPGPADDKRVSQFLSRVANLTPTRSLAEPGPLADYGLVEPALVVTLTLADGSTQTLEIGNANPFETAYYAQVHGHSGVHLVAALLAESAREMLDTPPVPPTPTPTPTPTLTPTPTPAS